MGCIKRCASIPGVAPEDLASRVKHKAAWAGMVARHAVEQPHQVLCELEHVLPRHRLQGREHAQGCADAQQRMWRVGGRQRHGRIACAIQVVVDYVVHPLHDALQGTSLCVNPQRRPAALSLYRILNTGK